MIGLIIVAAWIVINMIFVKWIRDKCGPFVGA